jgi:hypothetical protein
VDGHADELFSVSKRMEEFEGRISRWRKKKRHRLGSRGFHEQHAIRILPRRHSHTGRLWSCDGRPWPTACNVREGSHFIATPMAFMLKTIEHRSQHNK